MTEHLQQLGSNKTDYGRLPDVSILETFVNKYPDRDYEIKHSTSEFTSLCPKTGQPDFASITITYVADIKCIESKSLKLYLFSYRNEGSFMETICNRICSDLVECCSPRHMKVQMTFAARGGVKTEVEVVFKK